MPVGCRCEEDGDKYKPTRLGTLVITNTKSCLFRLYYKCVGTETIEYLDITSIYPHVTSAPQHFYLTKSPTILKKGRDTMLPINQLFGFIKRTVKPPKNLYFPDLPSGAISKHFQNLNECLAFGCLLKFRELYRKGTLS